MNTDTAGNPTPLVPAYCGRCGGPTDTGGLCASRCGNTVPMTRPAPESDVEQALARLVAWSAGMKAPLMYGTPPQPSPIDVDRLLSSHERLTREVERLRRLIVAWENFYPGAVEGHESIDAKALRAEARAIREAKP